MPPIENLIDEFEEANNDDNDELEEKILERMHHDLKENDKITKLVESLQEAIADEDQFEIDRRSSSNTEPQSKSFASTDLLDSSNYFQNSNEIILFLNISWLKQACVLNLGMLLELDFGFF